MKLKVLVMATLLCVGLSMQADPQTILQDAEKTVGDVANGPWIVGSGYGHGLSSHNNLVYGYLGYNFVTNADNTGFNAGIIGGYDDLWASGKSEVNSLSGGFQISQTGHLLSFTGIKFLTNIVTTVAAYQLVATPRDSTAPLGSITGTSITANLYSYKGFTLTLQGEYEVRAGQGTWDDKYLCGGLAISHSF